MDGMYNIKPVKSKKEFNTFLKVPRNIYEGDSNWVPPLDTEIKKILDTKKNPFFKNAQIKHWILVKGQVAVGRISAILNFDHINYSKKKTGFIGYFECVDDLKGSNLLFETACEWLKGAGMNQVWGPINLSTDNECGLLIEGFESPPVVQMMYNPKYYETLFSNFGFKKENDLLAFQITEKEYKDKEVLNRLKRLNELVQRKDGFVFRNFNMKDFNEEVEKVRILFNDYMSGNWGFVPLSKEEFDFTASGMKKIMDKNYAFIIELHGQAVGFSITIPDINEVLLKMNGKLLPFGIFKYLFNYRKIKGLRMVLMGVSKPYRQQGLESFFYYHSILECNRKGIEKVELSWVDENNITLINTMKRLNASLYKRYRVYRKNLY